MTVESTYTGSVSQQPASVLSGDLNRRDFLRAAWNGSKLGVLGMVLQSSLNIPTAPQARFVNVQPPSPAPVNLGMIDGGVPSTINYDALRSKWQEQGLQILGPQDPLQANILISQDLHLPENATLSPIELPPQVAEVVDEAFSGLPIVEGHVKRLIPLINGSKQPAYGQPDSIVGPNFVSGLFTFDIAEGGKTTQDLYLWLPPDLLEGRIKLNDFLPNSRYSPLVGGELSEHLTYRDMIRTTIHHEAWHSYMYSLMAREMQHDRDLFYDMMRSQGKSNKDGNPLMRAYFDKMGYVLFDEGRFGALLNQGGQMIKRADVTYRVSQENGIEIRSNHPADDWVLSYPFNCFGDPKIAEFENIARSEWRMRSPAVVFSIPDEAVANEYSIWKTWEDHVVPQSGDFFTQIEQYLRNGFPDNFFMNEDVVREKFTPKVSEAVLKWRASHNSDK